MIIHALENLLFRAYILCTFFFCNLAIEDDYKGPQLEDDKVTLQFMKDLMEHYKAQKRLHRKFAYKVVNVFSTAIELKFRVTKYITYVCLQILRNIDEYMREQPSLVDINVPDDEKFTICGDIHGQFYDLMNIFDINGLPSEKNPYLFNGDFVDRGSFSVECIFTLFGFKLLYPNHFFLSRGNLQFIIPIIEIETNLILLIGNHESINMNQMYGFTGEVTAKYNNTMANIFTQVFNWLPLCHCINQKILVMHGGLFSSDNVTLDNIRRIERNCQPPEEGLMCELLWSDPQQWMGRGPSKRGVGIQFGPDVTEAFCNLNKLDYIIRSHEVKDMGYEVAHNGQCITVFSAPNYWYVPQVLNYQNRTNCKRLFLVILWATWAHL